MVKNVDGRGLGKLWRGVEQRRQQNDGRFENHDSRIQEQNGRKLVGKDRRADEEDKSMRVLWRVGMCGVLCSR